MVAQGNALGKMIQKCVLVLKGQHKRAPLFCPFRANVLTIIVPRAIPWATIVIALSARRNRPFISLPAWFFAGLQTLSDCFGHG